MIGLEVYDLVRKLEKRVEELEKRLKALEGDV